MRSTTKSRRWTDYVVGVDIGGTHLRIGRMHTNGKLSHFEKTSNRVLYDRPNPLHNLAEFIAAHLLPPQSGRLRAVALAFPCLVDKQKKTVFSGPNLPQFDHVNVVDPLSARFRVPVFVGKDANFLLDWDLFEKRIPRDQIVLGFYVGTGLGNAIYLRGEFYAGAHGVAGELGHIPFPAGTRRCGCGNVGCIELYAAGQALHRLARERYPDTDISEIFTRHRAASPIQRYLDTMALPLAAEINIFDPHTIILGGGVVGMKQFPRADFQKRLLRHMRKPFPARDLQILYSTNNDHAGVLGAARYAVRAMGQLQ